jgi:hypothetical protein
VAESNGMPAIDAPGAQYFPMAVAFGFLVVFGVRQAALN